MTKHSKIRHPFQIQGSLSKSNYFEGWYFKQVHHQKNKTISFIFGFSTGKHDPHSFVQVIQSNPLNTAYFRFPLDAFKVEGSSYLIDKNRFSLHEIELHLSQDGLTIDGKLELSEHHFLESTWFQPNIMGIFAYIPNMECNHGVISMDHKVNGTLTINQETLDFDHEKGYLEKDWGVSFPKRYIWIQGNHFDHINGSVMISIADIPFLGLTFEGIIAQLDLGQRRIRLATYNGAKRTQLRKTEDGFEFELKKGSTILHVRAFMTESGLLKSPKLGSMNQTIKEGLGGKIELILKEKGQIEQRFISEHCGIELEGYLKDERNPK